MLQSVVVNMYAFSRHQACAETFFSTIKTELIYQERFKTREDARRAIFDYIEVFYN